MNEVGSPAAAAAAKSLQSCLTLCDPIDGSPPGSPNPGILQARTLEWVAISFPNAWKWRVKVRSLSRAWLLATPLTAAHQALLSMRFSRLEWGARLFLHSIKKPLSSSIVIYNKKYLVFVPIPGTELLKNPWNFLSDESHKGVLIFITNPFQPHLSEC